MPLPVGSRLLALVNPAAGDGTAEALIERAIEQVFTPQGIVVRPASVQYLFGREEELCLSICSHVNDRAQPFECVWVAFMHRSIG